MSFYPSHIAMSICYFEYCWNSAQGECHFLLCHSHTSDPSRLQMTKWIFRACIEEIKITRKSFLCPSTVILFFPLLCTQAYLSGPLSPTSLPGWLLSGSANRRRGEGNEPARGERGWKIPSLLPSGVSAPSRQPCSVIATSARWFLLSVPGSHWLNNAHGPKWQLFIFSVF